MSRSFFVRTDRDKELNLKDFTDHLKNYITLSTAELEIVHNKNNICPDNFDKVSLNTGLTVFAIADEPQYIYIEYDKVENNKFLWYIESRALEGRGRRLFVAAAAVIADLTDGEVESGDGAWHNADTYSSSELWNDYLNYELKNPDWYNRRSGDR